MKIFDSKTLEISNFTPIPAGRITSYYILHSLLTTLKISSS